MSPSFESGHDDGQLVNYLLGQLSPEETERIDELSITDDEVARRLRAAEDDLVDAYVSGALEGETLQLFERFYLSSPRRREKVKFARSLRHAIDRTAPAQQALSAVPAPLPVRAASARAPRSESTWKLTAAAALVVAAASTLVVEEVRLRRGLEEARRESAALGERARDLERQLADERAVVAAAQAPGVAPSAAAASVPAAAEPESLVLVPQTRALSAIAALHVPANRDAVTVALRLETNEFSRYQAALRDPATGRIVWRSAWITLSNPSPRATVSVRLPSELLKPQHYAVELSGQRGQTAGELVASYAFEAVRR